MWSWRAACAAVALLLATGSAHAQDSRALLEVELIPAGRAQIAAWIEDAEGNYLKTLALTHAVAIAGVGNRPGALQLNSGYRWPYGRREGVLPVWGHARASAPDAALFKRVIFQNRLSEGFASRTSSDQSADSYYCLSFERELSGRDALDATSCASVFHSDKGRFLTAQDEAGGYTEPFDQAADGRRSLDRWSLYPPRRDLADGCNPDQPPCFDHPDVATFDEHALSVMPELDAVARATPAGGQRQFWRFELPNDWPLGEAYVLRVEVHVEGDYNEAFNPEAYPGPHGPPDSPDWDPWSMEFGYAYRGQPSVVYEVPFSLSSSDFVEVRDPVGHGDLHGLSGALQPLDEAITDDPENAPGSGADRLLLGDRSWRVRARAVVVNPCLGEEPHPACGSNCTEDDDCGGGLRCSDAGQCAAACDGMVVPQVTELAVEPHPDPQRAHTWAVLSFAVPASEQSIDNYRVRVHSGGRVRDARTPDPAEPENPVALDVCADPDGGMHNRCLDMEPGESLQVTLAGLSPRTDYTIEVQAEDALCGSRGHVAQVAYSTPEIEYRTVSPCFVATATYGSPLATQVGVLRRVRDRYLSTHAPGRLLVQAYYRYGAQLADWIRERPDARRQVRAWLDPVVAWAERLLE